MTPNAVKRILFWVVTFAAGFTFGALFERVGLAGSAVILFASLIGYIAVPNRLFEWPWLDRWSYLLFGYVSMKDAGRWLYNHRGDGIAGRFELHGHLKIDFDKSMESYFRTAAKRKVCTLYGRRADGTKLEPIPIGDIDSTAELYDDRFDWIDLHIKREDLERVRRAYDEG